LQNVRTLRDGTHHTVLHLSPEHLGEVVITLDVRGTGVRLDMAAGGPALAALQTDLGRLRDDLAASGLDLSDVTLHSQDAGARSFTGRRPGQDPPAAYQSAAPGGDTHPVPDPRDQAARRPADWFTDGGLDVLA
jgi:hypothetical protein